jgi:N-acyl homoserine lactone hydrolase
METYRIHPIVMGAKVFDKSMMTYPHGQGQPYTIPLHEPRFAAIDTIGQYC